MAWVLSRAGSSQLRLAEGQGACPLAQDPGAWSLRFAAPAAVRVGLLPHQALDFSLESWAWAWSQPPVHPAALAPALRLTFRTVCPPTAEAEGTLQLPLRHARRRLLAGPLSSPQASASQ